jgi:hypothetical protein
MNNEINSLRENRGGESGCRKMPANPPASGWRMIAGRLNEDYRKRRAESESRGLCQLSDRIRSLEYA